MDKKTALVTGVSGQDGAYLSQLLLEKGYHVIGAMRRSSHFEFARLRRLGIENDVEPTDLDLVEPNGIARLIRARQPDEVYNLAAHSFVGSSWDQPLYVADVNGLGVVRVLDAIQTYSPHSRFYQASTSEMFGLVQEVPQSETTPLYPRSPYGVAKVYGHFITVNYRESFGLHASSGILFNHESPLRGDEFVTRKITLGMAELAQGRTSPIELGNLSTRRDWGFAGDYVRGMWLMTQQEQGDDYVLATGETTTIRDFVSFCAEAAGFEPEWSGEDVQETCVDASSGQTLVVVNPKFFRPAEVDLLIGDASKARERLGWAPTVTVRELAAMMVEADSQLLAENNG